MSKSGYTSRHWTLILNFMPNHHTVQEIFCNKFHTAVFRVFILRESHGGKKMYWILFHLNRKHCWSYIFLSSHTLYYKNIKLQIWQCILQINASQATGIATLAQLLYKVYYKNKLYGKYQTKSSMCLRPCN